MKRPEIVQAIKMVLQRVTPEAEVILYGSEARGDAHADSDIDLLILVNKESDCNETTTINRSRRSYGRRTF